MKTPFDNEAKYYDTFHQDRDYAAEAEEIRRRHPDAVTVLEIGCGTGNLTKELVKLGFEAVCIDPSIEMLKRHKGQAKWVIKTSIQDYPKYSDWNRFDLILATYDALNYVPFVEIEDVLSKMLDLGKEIRAEVWDPSEPVRPFTHKKANGCHRVRLGFRIGNIAHVWYIFWGKGLVISYHKLYLHWLHLRLR